MVEIIPNNHRSIYVKSMTGILNHSPGMCDLWYVGIILLFLLSVTPVEERENTQWLRQCFFLEETEPTAKRWSHRSWGWQERQQKGETEHGALSYPEKQKSWHRGAGRWHEHLSLDLSPHIIFCHGDAHSNHSNMSRSRDRGTLGAFSLSSLALLRFSEKPSFKKYHRKDRDTQCCPLVSTCACTAKHIRSYMGEHIYTTVQACIHHTYTQREILMCYCTSGWRQYQNKWEMFKEVSLT